MLEDKKTKIITTIGPATSSPDNMQAIMEAGANIFRFNLKHNSIKWHKEHINRAIEVSKKIGKTIGIMIDLQGPELRIETYKEQTVKLKAGDSFWVGEKATAQNPICIPETAAIDALKKGDFLMVEDGYYKFDVLEKKDKKLYLKAVYDASIHHRKGINLPGKSVKLPSLTKQDHEKLKTLVGEKIDFAALSFVRNVKDIKNLRKVMDNLGITATIVSKIETQQALKNIDGIINESAAIMLARGDLGIEIPVEEIAYWGKIIIEKCRLKKKPVITATQMLQSMIDKPVPTRAEVTDVANAVFDGSDAVMLSAESTVGKYPVKCVSMLSKIAKYNEKRSDLTDIYITPKDNSDLIIHGAISMLDEDSEVKIDKIITFTKTGATALGISRFRPHQKIIAITNSEYVQHQLTIAFGIHPIYEVFPAGVINIFTENPIMNNLKKNGIIKKGERLLVIHGRFWNKPDVYNSVEIMMVS